MNGVTLVPSEEAIEKLRGNIVPCLFYRLRDNNYHTELLSVSVSYLGCKIKTMVVQVMV